MRVKATREGLNGQKTASGWVINASVPFVALPSHAALRLWVKVTKIVTIDGVTAPSKTVKALVLDVGPWYENDDAYVFGGQRPMAETATPPAQAAKGLTSNGAGIDLGEAVWNELGMTDNGEVEWEFV